MSKYAKTLFAFFCILSLSFLALSAVSVAADRALGNAALIATLFCISLIAAFLCCILIHRQYRGRSKVIHMLPPQTEAQLRPLPPWEQFEALAQLHLKERGLLDRMSVERLLTRLLSDNSHTHVIENLNEHLQSILRSDAFGYCWTYFCLVYIQLEDHDAYILKECNDHLFLEDFRRMYDVVDHAFSQSLSTPHLTHSVEIKDSCVFLVNLYGSTPDTPRETLSAQIDAICGICLDTIDRLSASFNLTVQASVSAPFCDIMETYGTFTWLQTLRDYVDFMHGTIPVLGPRDHGKFIMAPHAASPLLEKAYYSALLSENYVQAEQALFKMEDHVLARDALSIHNLKQVISQCLSTAEEIAAANHPRTATTTLDWREKLESCKNQTQLETIIHCFFNTLTGLASATECESNNTAQRIASYLDEHYCSPTLSVITLADEFSLSQSYISRIFKKQIGLSIPDYIHEKRVRLAKHLLLTTSLSVNEIAEQVGYSTPWTLNRVFKRLVDMTPGAFRQLSQAQQEVNP